MKTQQKLQQERLKIYHELAKVEAHIFIARNAPDTPMGRKLQTRKVKMCATRLQRLWSSINLAGLGRSV